MNMFVTDFVSENIHKTQIIENTKIKHITNVLAKIVSLDKTSSRKL